MHAHDRTLLSQLGFSDPDKRSRRHDLACQYLALPVNRERIIREVVRGEVIPQSRPVFEAPLSKGHDQYKTVIGFMDLILPYAALSSDDDGKQWKMNSLLIVEVKIAPVAIGDVLRQVKLYREFNSYESRSYLVATAFPLSPLDVASLRASGIYHIRLGEAFEAWARAQEQEVQDEADSFTI